MFLFLTHTASAADSINGSSSLNDQALILNPNDTAGLYDKAFSLVDDGKYEEAIAYFDKILAMNSTNSDTLNAIILNGKGLALYDLGKYEEAIAYFDKILAMNSSNIDAVNDALNNKGIALNDLGK